MISSSTVRTAPAGQGAVRSPHDRRLASGLRCRSGDLLSHRRRIAGEELNGCAQIPKVIGLRNDGQLSQRLEADIYRASALSRGDDDRKGRIESSELADQLFTGTI